VRRVGWGCRCHSVDLSARMAHRSPACTGESCCVHETLGKSRARVDALLSLASLIVRPHPKHANDSLFLEDFVDDTVLNIDAT
jgi:hypothetical protein